MISFVITREDADQTLISFLKKRFQTTPLSLIYKLFRTQKIKAGEEIIRYYHYRLKTGGKIIIHDDSLKVANLVVSAPTKSSLNLTKIYEDKNIVIVRKEHGISMVELDQAAQHYFYQQDIQQYQELSQKYFSFVAVHRLDKLTQGLVIYPKNPIAKRILYNSITDKEKIIKQYLAFCENSPKKSLPNYVSGYLWKNEPEQKMEFALNSTTPHAKFCALEIKKTGEKNNHRILEITLHTGRKHQIRAILSYFGLPIMGDKKYGSKTVLKNKINLFAYKITFLNLPSPLSYLNGQVFQISCSF